MGSFVEHFNGKSWKNELSFCPVDLTKLDKKGTVHFLFAIRAYVHDALWKWQLIVLSVKLSEEQHENAICTIIFNPKLSQIRRFLLSVYYTDLCPGHS